MITAVDFKTGMIFRDSKGQTFEVLSYMHHRKSQAKAVVKIKLRNMETGSITENSYRPEEKFEQIHIQKKQVTYLYTDKNDAHFMNSENFEQFSVPVEKLKNQHKFLTENMQVQGLYLGDEFFDIELPIKMKMKIASTVPGVKGDTVSNLTKIASLENGVEIKVPLFIKEGDEIIIDTRTGEYVERA